MKREMCETMKLIHLSNLYIGKRVNEFLRLYVKRYIQKLVLLDLNLVLLLVDKRKMSYYKNIWWEKQRNVGTI